MRAAAAFGSTLLAVRLAKPHPDAAASRDNAWLALLDLGTDLLYDARGEPARCSHSTCHTTSAISADRSAR
jgi:hypothetical protein